MSLDDKIQWKIWTTRRTREAFMQFISHKWPIVGHGIISLETKTLGLNNISASSFVSDSGRILSSQQASQSQSNKQLSEQMKETCKT
jgi:hypothetical protein